MKTLKVSDSLSARHLGASRLVNHLTEALQGLADGVDFGAEDRIPAIELWVSGDDEVMTLKRAIAIGRKLVETSGAPVHFHELRSQSVMFFVFANALLYPHDEFHERQFAEYGTPFERWSQSVLAD